MLGPRYRGVLRQDTKFMAIAMLASTRSKDPSTQVGACLVSNDGRVIGTGYNGFPRGIDSEDLPWDKTADSPEDTKYLYVSHAKTNAIDNSDKHRIKGSRIYTTLFPYNECAKRIVQNQIEEVIYLSDKYHDLPETIASRRLLDLADITYRKFKPHKGVEQITIDFTTGQWTCK